MLELREGRTMRIQDFNFRTGQRLRGLAPIGLRWEASINCKGAIVPDGKLPSGEFAVTDYRDGNRWIPIELHPSQRNRLHP
jgi:hypothetical protein